MLKKSTLIRAEGWARATFATGVIIAIYVAVIISGHDSQIALIIALVACWYIPGRVISSMMRQIRQRKDEE